METASGNMCRCCASEGVFKDLATTYHWMGEEEIYGDMLRECFDIQLSSMENADGGICEVCITQLRNASNFKKQVLLTEEQFKSHLQNVFKPGIVKVEVTRDEGNSTDDNATDDGMSGPEFDDIPIKIEGTTKNEKEDLEIKPKKRSSVKPSTSTAKKSVSSDDEPLKKRKTPSIPYEFYDVTKDVEKPYQCKVCAATFPKLRAITQHFKHVHLRQRRKTFACRICGKQLTPRRQALHLDKEHNIPAPTCGCCGRKFAFQNLLLHHQKTYHMGEKDFICPECGKGFDRATTLRKHQRSHSNLRPHTCNVCSKSFKCKSNLKVHEAIHAEEKKYSCHICGMGFTQKTSLNYHFNKRHPNES